jgi:hypothetical protein
MQVDHADLGKEAVAGNSTEGSNNSPKISTGTPVYALWLGIKPLQEVTDRLSTEVRRSREVFSLLEAAPGSHDQLDRETLVKVYELLHGESLARARRELHHSLLSLESVAQSVNTMFGNVPEIGLEYRLQLHLSEAKELEHIFKDLPDEYMVPSTRSLIREKLVWALLSHSVELLEQYSLLGRSLKTLVLPSDVAKEVRAAFDKVSLLITETFLLTTPPSKISAAATSKFESQLIEVKESLAHLRQSARYQCQLLGMEFRDRRGLVPVEPPA